MACKNAFLAENSWYSRGGSIAFSGREKCVRIPGVLRKNILYIKHINGHYVVEAGVFRYAFLAPK
jgi:hypothetical protein